MQTLKQWKIWDVLILSLRRSQNPSFKPIPCASEATPLTEPWATITLNSSTGVLRNYVQRQILKFAGRFWEAEILGWLLSMVDHEGNTKVPAKGYPKRLVVVRGSKRRPKANVRNPENKTNSAKPLSAWCLIGAEDEFSEYCNKSFAAWGRPQSWIFTKYQPQIPLKSPGRVPTTIASYSVWYDF